MQQATSVWDQMEIALSNANKHVLLNKGENQEYNHVTAVWWKKLRCLLGFCYVDESIKNVLFKINLKWFKAQICL